MTGQLLLCFDAPAPVGVLDPCAEIKTQEQADRAGARIDAIWALAEARWQEGGRPLRFLGCSYYVVDSGQMSDRRAYLTEEEAHEVHQLTLQYSLYTNDPYRARERNLARMAARRAERTAQLVAA